MSDTTVIGTIRQIVQHAETGRVVYNETVFNSEPVLFEVAIRFTAPDAEGRRHEYDLKFQFDPPLMQIPAEPVEGE